MCINVYFAHTHNTHTHTHTHICVCARSEGKKNIVMNPAHKKKLQDNTRVSEYNDECKDVRELDTLDENTKVIPKKKKFKNFKTQNP